MLTVLAAALLLTGCSADGKYVIESVDGKPADSADIYDAAIDFDHITVYLDDGASQADAAAIGAELKKVDHVTNAELVDKDQAAESYREQLGEDVFQDMTGKDNPLPYSYKVAVDSETMQNTEQYRAVVEQLRKVRLVKNGETVCSVSAVSSHRDLALKLSLNSVELDPDGTASLEYSLYSAGQEGTWKQDDDRILITCNDEKTEFTLKGKELTTYFGEHQYVFVKQ